MWLIKQYISDRNIFLTCSLQMTAQMWATADSLKLTAVWILMFFTGQIKIPGKGVGLETLRWMREAWSCMNTAQK